MMMRGDLLWRKVIQLLNRKYRSGGLCDPVTGDYIHQKPKNNATTITGLEQLYKSSSGTHSAIMINAPTVRNQCKCVLPRHSCISYLENVKIYESALGAEYQEEIDHGFEVFSKFIDENILRNS